MPRATAVKHIAEAAVEAADRCVLTQFEPQKSAVAVDITTSVAAVAAAGAMENGVDAAAAPSRRSSRSTVRAVSGHLGDCGSRRDTADKVSLTRDAGDGTLRAAPLATSEPNALPLSKRQRRGRAALGTMTASAVIKEELVAELVVTTGDPLDGSALPLEISAKACLSTSAVCKLPPLDVTVEPLKQEIHHCVGAHVSAAGGLYKAVLNAKAIGCRAFALFLKSQRQWAAKPLEDETAAAFKKACKENDYAPHLILPHGSYLLNCGSPDEEVYSKSRATLLDEMQRCEKLGLTLYNFHPGSTCGKITTQECIDRIAESVNYAHSHTYSTIAVIENMSCQGHTIGGTFEEIALIISKVKDKSRVGVCIDTCHAFAAGYDISNEEGYEAMIAKFDSVIGLKYLKGMHLNDSKGALGCHLDRHANIGKGCIGLDGFRRVMNDPRLQNIPLILETPFTSDEGYAEEIRLLYSLCNAGSSGHCPQSTSRRRKQNQR